MVVGLLGIGPAVARAQPRVILGPADGLLLGQPEVYIGLEDPADPDVLVGPMYDNVFVLDTAANGLLFAERSYWTAVQTSDPDRYAVEQNGGADVQYTEQGVAGTEDLDVFVPYNVYIAGDDISGEFMAGQFRAFGDPGIQLGDIAGLAGMPVMINRDIRVHLRDLVNPDADFKMNTAFDDVPAVTPDTYIVPLTRLPAEHTGQQNPTDPRPDFADIPVIPDTRYTHHGHSVTVDTIVDTGAQLSIISHDTAVALGIDPQNEALGYTTVGGIGGQATVPIVHVGDLAIPTTAGVDLVFTDLDMVVIDVAGIDAILGVDALTGGYLEPQIDAVLEWVLGNPVSDDYGYFADVLFDFVGEEWSLRLDVNPEFNQVVPEPMTLALLVIGGVLVTGRRS